MKFGGSSLRNAGRIKQVAHIIKGRLSLSPMVVVSAFDGVTEKLIALSHNKIHFSVIENIHKKIIKDLSLDETIISGVISELKCSYKGSPSLPLRDKPKQLDKIISFGERLSARIVSSYLNQKGIKAQAFDAYDIGLLTDSHFGQASPLKESYPVIKKEVLSIIRKKIVPVITGFIGRDKQGNITTLGRNGSDYTATIIAACINAREVQLWSDSEGIMSADPRIVKDARPIEQITFDEASELAYYSRRFHPLTLLECIRKNIPVRILNTYNPTSAGTIIRPLSILRREGNRPVKCIVYKKDIFLLTITSPRMLMQYGFLEKIFKVFAKYKIIIDMIATSEISVSVTTDRKYHLNLALEELSRRIIGSDVKIKEKQAIVCVIGQDIKYLSGLSGDIFMALKQSRPGGIDIKMISQGYTRTNIAFVVDNCEVRRAVKALHKTLLAKWTTP
jgi:aspartate kinase